MQIYFCRKVIDINSLKKSHIPDILFCFMLEILITAPFGAFLKDYLSEKLLRNS